MSESKVRAQETAVGASARQSTPWKHAGTSRAFLDANGVPYEIGTSRPKLPSADIAARARDFTVLIECWK